MSDQIKTEAAPETTAPDPFMEAWESMGLTPKAEHEPEKSVAKSDTSPVDTPTKVVQKEPESPREEPEQAAVDSAMTELRRAGLKPESFKGKSEGALLVAMGEALNTVRRDQDRRIQELKAAQGNPTDSTKSDQGSTETVPAGSDASAKQAAPGPTVDLEALSSALLDDGISEVTAQSVVSVIESLAKQNASLEARLNADAQARQLAPLEQAIKEETAGIEALSNPEKLEQFLTMAKAKAELDDIELGTDPVEVVRRVIRHALGDQERAPAALQRVKTVAPAGTQSAPTSKKQADPFMDKWKELGLPS